MGVSACSVPGEGSVASDDFSELGFDQDQGVGQVIADFVELLGLKGVVRAGKEEFELARVIEGLPDEANGLQGFAGDDGGAEVGVPLFDL